MNIQYRDALIERVARRQFAIDNPNADWSAADASSRETDKRALYLFHAEQYLTTCGVIPRAQKHAA
jgi:hypothetical protein